MVSQLYSNPCTRKLESVQSELQTFREQHPVLEGPIDRLLELAKEQAPSSHSQFTAGYRANLTEVANSVWKRLGISAKSTLASIFEASKIESQMQQQRERDVKPHDGNQFRGVITDHGNALFQAELNRMMMYSVRSIDGVSEDDVSSAFNVFHVEHAESFRAVEIYRDGSFWCSCLGREHIGVPCRHVIRVLSSQRGEFSFGRRKRAHTN